MYAAAADWHAHALEEEEAAAAAYGQQPCSGGGPAASGEAVAALPEITSVKDDECSVCLQEFEAGSRLRMMPCAAPTPSMSTASSAGYGLAMSAHSAASRWPSRQSTRIAGCYDDRQAPAEAN
ncbi:unnamed protein product [Urochloa humidicola]